MSCISSTERARIVAQITTKEAQLAALNTAYTAALTASEIKSYKFDTGEGSQSTTRRDPAELYSQIRQIEMQLDRLYRRLNGGGIVNLNMRRRSYVR